MILGLHTNLFAASRQTYKLAQEQAVKLESPAARMYVTYSTSTSIIRCVYPISHPFPPQKQNSVPVRRCEPQIAMIASNCARKSHRTPELRAVSALHHTHTHTHTFCFGAISKIQNSSWKDEERDRMIICRGGWKQEDSWGRGIWNVREC
jgi:hypothetical protein